MTSTYSTQRCPRDDPANQAILPNRRLVDLLSCCCGYGAYGRQEDVCFQSSNVLRLHALAIFLVLTLSVTGAVLAGKAIRLNRRRWPLCTMMTLGSLALFVSGFLAAQYALFGMCPL